MSLSCPASMKIYPLYPHEILGLNPHDPSLNETCWLIVIENYTDQYIGDFYWGLYGDYRELYENIENYTDQYIGDFLLGNPW